ncbi:hypothetical protein CIPAW_03G088100 [Carya illinoinensis]|uniref:No apical meristem-associated C-terminal domain-containing protein n=1 Tax=Carya illinoinensis TaxID=32201 RepID=A0A8T1R1C8_CARIL|nr:hypothetical protein CIPAW_03G088100 [Carya illinoinensis]
MDSQDQEHIYFTNLLNQNSQLDPTYNRQSGNSPMTIDDSPPLPPNEFIGVKKSVRGANFTSEEDKLLVSAWLNCSVDTQYKETTNERTIKSLIHQWLVIQKATNKFCAKLAQVEGLNQSGMTEQDKFEKVKIMYQSLEKCSFQFEHCWHLLKDQPKWIWRATKDVPPRRKTMSPSLTPISIRSEKEKRKAQGKQPEENLQLRKMKYTLLEESRAHEKEFCRLKAEKMEYDKEKEKKKLRLENERLRLEVEKMRIEAEKEQSKIRQEDERLRLEA